MYIHIHICAYIYVCKNTRGMEGYYNLNEQRQGLKRNRAV